MHIARVCLEIAHCGFRIFYIWKIYVNVWIYCFFRKEERNALFIHYAIAYTCIVII